MSQSVTYADLQFVRTPPEKTPQPLQEGPGDGDLTYENIRAPKPQAAEAPNIAKQHKGPNKPSWPIALGLLGASLFLLATTVGFGVRYRQVSQRLHEALEASAAESSRLALVLGAQERGLVQKQWRLREAEAELNQSRAALRESQRLVNSTRGQLQEQAGMLAAAIQERRAVEEALNATLAKACTDWCPEGWLLHGGKCLFFSAQRKNWPESRTDCEERAARLLIIKSEVSKVIPGPLYSYLYWIGCYVTSSKEESKWGWFWLDGLRCRGTDSNHYRCTTLNSGKWTSVYCFEKHHYICEKPAEHGQPVPLLG